VLIAATDLRDELRTTDSRETPAFLGPPGDAVFGCLHLPLRPAAAVVVICSSIGAEWKYGYRREVVLARLLARHGIAAVRFHYLGTGHSDGDDTGFDRMVHDANRAAAWARDRAGATRIAFVGTRLGALVAAAAARPGAAPVVAFDAPDTATGYFRELFRAARVARLADRHPLPGDDVDPRALLEAGRPADIVGYTLPATLYRTVVGRCFADELGDGGREVLLIDSAPPGDPAPHRRAERLRERGLRVATITARPADSAWLPNGARGAEEHSAPVVRLLEDTVAWLRGRLRVQLDRSS
jgi:alpha/beta superfamily hydrolase